MFGGFLPQIWKQTTDVGTYSSTLYKLLNIICGIWLGLLDGLNLFQQIDESIPLANIIHFL